MVENTTGKITIRVTDRSNLNVRGRSDDRSIQPGDIEIERKEAAGVIVRSKPADGATVHLELEVPYQSSLGLTTTSGKITVEGMPAALDIATKTGDLHLALPWYSSLLDFRAESPPQVLHIPDHLKQKRKKGGLSLGHHPRVGRELAGYSDVRVRTESSGTVELREIPIPEDSPIKLHWQGPEALQNLFRAKGRVRLQERDGRTVEPERRPGADLRAEVGLVDLLVHVADKEGRAITDLQPDDFQVTEDSRTQTIRQAKRVDIPANIVVFLDWNNSMLRLAPATLAAVERWIDTLRPGDKMALHVLTRNTVHMLPRLTQDSKDLRRGLRSFTALLAANSQQSRNKVGGASALWDPMLVSMIDELPKHDDELNLFIPITMGVDVFSKVPFTKLRRGVEQMASDLNIRTYPIAVGGSLQSGTGHKTWAPHLEAGRKNLGVLAKAGDGRVFEAATLEQIGAVLPKILGEVGSAYSLSYAPSNQEHDGEWRSVAVEVNRPDAVVRHRPGYFARP